MCVFFFVRESHIQGVDTSPYRVCKERAEQCTHTKRLPLGLVEEEQHHLPAQKEGRFREREDLRLQGEHGWTGEIKRKMVVNQSTHSLSCARTPNPHPDTCIHTYRHAFRHRHFRRLPVHALLPRMPTELELGGQGRVRRVLGCKSKIVLCE